MDLFCRSVQSSPQTIDTETSVSGSDECPAVLPGCGAVELLSPWFHLYLFCRYFFRQALYLAHLTGSSQSQCPRHLPHGARDSASSSFIRVLKVSGSVRSCTLSMSFISKKELRSYLRSSHTYIIRNSVYVFYRVSQNTGSPYREHTDSQDNRRPLCLSASSSA